MRLYFVRRQGIFRPGLPVKGGRVIGIAGRTLQYAAQNDGRNQFCRLRARFGVFAGGGQKSAEDGNEFFLQQRAEAGSHGGFLVFVHSKCFQTARPSEKTVRKEGPNRAHCSLKIGVMLFFVADRRHPAVSGNDLGVFRQSEDFFADVAD